MNEKREKELREWSAFPENSEWRELFEVIDRLRRERDEAQKMRDRLTAALEESTESISDLCGKYMTSWKCSTTVPDVLCFDCIRCLRLRLKECL